MTIHFYPIGSIPDDQLKFAVIAAKYRCPDGSDKWLFCRHKQRTTWEIPGGHREPGETPRDTAKRELYEETGAIDFDLQKICIYGVEREDGIRHGILCLARVNTLGPLPPEMEIGEIRFFDTMPENLTYPSIQPFLFDKVKTLSI